ncbi:uncharacterized protein DNG_05360 [Cephalotrichum gorgonifer]|uniref:BHLH domain-containing protein n=1 Tax=Cephalotrichum gorgonifer TaxID=2041049 RepID=A0AAE8SW69_9PEZI|nr:uncharacterized protein DNG_05360 [Cephalotrichum gorgonifer]
MDPNFLNDMELFPRSNQPNTEPLSAGAVPPTSSDGSLWNPSIALGVSDEATPGLSYAQQNQGGMPYGAGGSSRPPFPVTTIPAPAPAGRKRDGRGRKRAKVDSDASALESADYWIHLDDDDLDNRLGGSFEIDFSGRRNETKQFTRPMPAFYTMGSTPGLGTGLYTTANLSLLRGNDFIDDAALDNALSEDEDGWDSLNLTDQLSKIETEPPAEVPPREGLYSTPLSWEKPQLGLPSDPMLSGFSPNTPLLSDMEQKNLLAIALNTNRPPPANFGPGFGTGFGFGYGYDVLGNGFPTLGADTLLESLGAPNLGDLSRPLEQPRPIPQPPFQSQAPMAPSSQTPLTKARDQSSGLPQSQPPQTARSQQQGQQRQQGQQAQKQPLHDRERQGPPSQSQQPPSKLESSTPAQSTSQPQQSHPPESKRGIRGQAQTQEPTTAEKTTESSSQPVDTEQEDKSKEKAKPGDRAAHNDIERKYRMNLKDRISELRDCVPALRTINEEGLEEDEGSAAAQALPKVSKGTVLTKATEYIHVLERRNKAIMREHQELSRRLQAFEQLLNATARQPFPMPSYSRALFDPRGFC